MMRVIVNAGTYRKTVADSYMKAIVWTKYGSADGLQLQEVPKPVPKDNQVLIKIFATTVTAGDCEQRSLKLPFWYALPMRAYVGLNIPKRITILGMELAGEIESVGREVKLYGSGDQVFAATGFVGMGTCAEYICMPEEPEEGALATKPNNMTYEEAAAAPVGGLEALCFLRQGNIQGGQKVLINGAGGTIGTFAVQLASYFGAEVTAVDSGDKLDMLRSIGASSVIDYTRENFTTSAGSPECEGYDLFLDVVSRSSFSDGIKSLKKNGCFLIANPGPLKIIRGGWTTKTSGKKVVFGRPSYRTKDLIFLKELIEAGRVKSIIDRRFPLEQTAEAHRYVDSGSKKGNVVITIG